MAKNILITGARTYACLDIGQDLHQQGHQIIYADTCLLPIARFTHFCAVYCRYPSPSFQLKQFIARLHAIIKQYHIDMIIPCSEEVFFISAFKKQFDMHCEVLVPSFELIQGLHNKYQVLALAQDCGITCPETRLLQNKEDLRALEGDYIIKPLYSRFGQDIMTIEQAKVSSIQFVANQYIAQACIHGQEYCTYMLARKGRVVALSVYLPEYRLKRSAAVYFQPVRHQKIESFMTNFAKKFRLDGQYGFDIIENKAGCYLIECNPRGNSGVHCFKGASFTQGLFRLDAEPAYINPNPVMIAYAMRISILPNMLARGQLKRYWLATEQASDVLAQNDVGFAMVKSVLFSLEMLTLMCRYRVPFKRAAIHDIEWNGEEISIA